MAIARRATVTGVTYPGFVVFDFSAGLVQKADDAEAAKAGSKIERWHGVVVVLGVAEKGDHDALNNEFVRRDQFRVGRIFRAKKRAGTAQQVTLQGGFPVD